MSVLLPLAAGKQLAAAQQLIQLPPGRLRPLLTDLDERITDAVLLARGLKRGRVRKTTISMSPSSTQRITDGVLLRGGPSAGGCT